MSLSNVSLITILLWVIDPLNLNGSNLRQSGQEFFRFVFADQPHVFSTANEAAVTVLKHSDDIATNFTFVNFSFFWPLDIS
jgi:hypothetical protein